MAVFGAIASAAPNVLFDAAKVDQAAQGFARNQLLTSNAQQDQQQQTYQRDTQARIAMARELVNLPEAQAAAEWGSARQRLQAAGFGQGLPDQFPGMEHIKAVAGSDLTTFERLKIEEQRRASEGLQSLFGGTGGGAASPMPAVGGGGGQMSAAPVSMGAPMQTAAPARVGGTGSVLADNADAARRREVAMRTLQGPELEAELAAISAGRAQALTGLGPNTQYRAPDGVRGVYAGVPAAPPGVPVLSSGPAPAGQAAATQTAGGGSSPALPQLISGGPMAGLTQEQASRFQGLSRIPNVNAASLMSQVESTRQSNLSLIRQQMQDARTARLDAERDAREERRDRRAEAKDVRSEPNGPFRGTSLDATMLNTLTTASPSSQEYAIAYGNYGAERRNIDGSTTRPDMSMFPAPAYAPPGSAPAGAAPPSQAGAPSSPGFNPSLGAAPTNALAPQSQAAAAPGGRAYGRAEVQASTQASPQAREAVRKAESEAGRVTGAIDRFVEIFAEQGGGSLNAFINNPASPQAQRLLAAYEGMKATMCGEAFLNTGVLQPAEAKMLDDVLMSPQSLRGYAATPDAMRARLNEFKEMINRNVQQQRLSAGISPEVSVPGPGGQGSASPPQPGAPRRLTFNPATGKIE